MYIHVHVHVLLVLKVNYKSIIIVSILKFTLKHVIFTITITLSTSLWLSAHHSYSQPFILALSPSLLSLSPSPYSQPFTLVQLSIAQIFFYTTINHTCTCTCRKLITSIDTCTVLLHFSSKHPL